MREDTHNGMAAVLVDNCKDMVVVVVMVVVVIVVVDMGGLIVEVVVDIVADIDHEMPLFCVVCLFVCC